MGRGETPGLCSALRTSTRGGRCWSSWQSGDQESPPQAQAPGERLRWSRIRSPGVTGLLSRWPVSPPQLTCTAAQLPCPTGPRHQHQRLSLLQTSSPTPAPGCSLRTCLRLTASAGGWGCAVRGAPGRKQSGADQAHPCCSATLPCGGRKEPCLPPWDSEHTVSVVTGHPLKPSTPRSIVDR